MIRVGYFMRAAEDVYAAIRQAMPKGVEVLTLDAGRPAMDLLPELDCVIAGKLSADMIRAGARLKLIQTPGVGYDGIDLDAAGQAGIPVAFTPCGNTDEVAEHTIMLMLAVSRRLSEIDAALRQGQWMMWSRRTVSHSLKGKSLGLVGFGRIGQAVARRASAFGMKTVYCDPITVGGYERRDLDTLIGESDYLSLHVPLTPGTRGMITAARISAMKPGAYFINTARGELVDEPALIEALKTGRLGGAGLDVFANEPPPAGHPLFELPNVVLTPHVGSGTVESLEEKAAWYSQNIQRVMAGQEPLSPVPELVPAAAGRLARP